MTPADDIRIAKEMGIPIEQFAHKIIKNRREYFIDIFPSVIQVKMCGKEPIYHLWFVRDIKGEYYGWEDKDGISMIHPSFILLAVCFPYGIENAKKRGGDTVRLTIIQEKL